MVSVELLAILVNRYVSVPLCLQLLSQKTLFLAFVFI